MHPNTRKAVSLSSINCLITSQSCLGPTSFQSPPPRIAGAREHKKRNEFRRDDTHRMYTQRSRYHSVDASILASTGISCHTKHSLLSISGPCCAAQIFCSPPRASMTANDFISSTLKLKPPTPDPCSAHSSPVSVPVPESSHQTCHSCVSSV